MPDLIEQKTIETASTPEGSVTVETRAVEATPPPEPEEPKWLERLIEMQGTQQVLPVGLELRDLGFDLGSCLGGNQVENPVEHGRSSMGEKINSSRWRRSE